VKYEEPQPISREEAELALGSGNASRICSALVSIALHEPDWAWAQDRCLQFMGSPDPEVRGLAVTCIGHIARIHRMLDLPVVEAALKAGLSDPDIQGRVEDAIDDIETFMRVRVRRL
jgi:hypothetical protein